uniref:FMRFamide-like neuropeptides 14 n=1 Tax=Ascaris suum TaxID=6253 RepID=F1LET0_ASCSU
MNVQQAGLLLLLGVIIACVSADAPQTCSQVMASPGEENHNKMLLCQLFESSTLLAQLGALVSEGLDRLMITQGVVPDVSAEEEGQSIEKRKHEYLRFGKRKHEYLRFGRK